MSKQEHEARQAAMRELTITMADALLPDSREVLILVKVADNCMLIQICAPEDMLGRLIGQGGQTVRALRLLLKAAAAKYGVRCELNIGPYAQVGGGDQG